MTPDPTKKRIQELVPEVMELRFGCEIARERMGIVKMTGFHKYDQSAADSAFDILVVDRRGSAENIDPSEKEFEILGSPITLAVVLRAIGISRHFNEDYLSVTDTGLLFESDYENGGFKKPDTNIFWNLAKDSYDDQSEETKLFIGKLLGV